MGLRTCIALVMAAASVRARATTCTHNSLTLGFILLRTLLLPARCRGMAQVADRICRRAQPIKVTPQADSIETPACSADISADGKVNVDDLLALLASYGSSCIQDHQFQI